MRPRSRRRPKTNEKKGEQIMVGVWIALQDVNEEKTDVSNFILLVLHKYLILKNFSSNIDNLPNLRNNLVHFVFVFVVVFGEKRPKL